LFYELLYHQSVFTPRTSHFDFLLLSLDSCLPQLLSQLQAARVSDLEAKDEEHRSALTSLAAQHEEALKSAVNEAIEHARSEAAAAATEAASEAEAETQAAVEAAVEAAMEAAVARGASKNQASVHDGAAPPSSQEDSPVDESRGQPGSEVSANGDLVKQEEERETQAAAVAVESARAAALENDVTKLRSELKAYAEVSHCELAGVFMSLHLT